MQKFTTKDIIHPEQALTLDGLFHQRALRHPEKNFCHYYDPLEQNWQVITWAQSLAQIGLWQAAMQAEGLQPGDRVAIMLRNCPEWVIFDQAALGLGLVTVPLYTSDRAENVAYVLQDCGAKLLLVDSTQHWSRLSQACANVTSLTRVISLRSVADSDPLLCPLSKWLNNGTGSKEFQHLSADPQQLASIIYTSGTTGNPKGVMLSHANLLYNAWASLQTFDVFIDDTLLSFLPLSHIFERAIGYYLVVMAGATVFYARSMQQLQEDLVTIKPTLIICVPRVYERILASIHQKLSQAPRIMTVLFNSAVKVGHYRFEYQQKRRSWHPRLLLWPLFKRLVADKVLGKLGGHLRFSISGGAALSPDISRVFIGLGLPVLQGYGLTETSPVISVNRVVDNQPASVGKIIPGIQVRIAENGALLTKGPHLMQGYWNNPQATEAMYSEDGWLDTGDVARLDDEGRIFITGRIKEIIVLSNGEKVPPVDIEAAIQNDPLFEQVMVVGEGKAYLSAFAVINDEQWQALTQATDFNNVQFGSAWPDVLRSPQAKHFAMSRIDAQMKQFPGYAKIRRITLLAEAWSTENGLLTATQKLKRTDVLDRYRQEYETMYRGYLESTFNRGAQ
jgi:long-chain acyl-CoA synthetase